MPRNLESVGHRNLATAGTLLLAAAALTGCAARTSFAGISFAPGAAEAEIQALAVRASGGDRHAQLELGIRYEEGDGVPVDWRRAERLYRRAATASGGTIMVYVPPVRPGGRGSVMPMSAGPRVPGLPAARERLRALLKRRSTEGERRSL